MLRGLARLPLALLLVDSFDEAASGMPVNALFALRETYDARIAALSAAVFVVPFVVALLIEAPLLVWLERFPRHRVLAVGLSGMAGALLLCALAPDLFTFAIGFSLYAPSSGIACGIAQAALMDAAPERREQSMTEWALAGWIGDLCGPLLLWTSAALGFGWRGAFLCVVGALCLPVGYFWVNPSAVAQPEAEEDDEDGEPRLLETLRLLLKQRTLFWWAFGVALCSLLDEVVAGLVGLRLHEETGSTQRVAEALLAFTLGGVAGLVLLKPLLARVDPIRLLRLSCWGCASAYGAWLVSDSVVWSTPLLFVAGVFVAAHYPIAQAQAYRALPERSTLVAAAGQPFMILDMALPLLVGWSADRYGIVVALGLLAIQPFGLLVVACVATRRRRDRAA